MFELLHEGESILCHSDVDTLPFIELITKTGGIPVGIDSCDFSIGSKWLTDMTAVRVSNSLIPLCYETLGLNSQDLPRTRAPSKTIIVPIRSIQSYRLFL